MGRIDSTLLKPYLALRSDWGQFEKGFDEEAEGTPEGGADGRGLKDRFGRLSVMMKELEGIKREGITMAMPTIPSAFAGSFSISTRPFGA